MNDLSGRVSGWGLSLPRPVWGDLIAGISGTQGVCVEYGAVDSAFGQQGVQLVFRCIALEESRMTDFDHVAVVDGQMVEIGLEDRKVGGAK